ncbi:MAG: carbohydrate kinase [Propionibacteriales bacterium]|nr:carbohydrate kinase [Propionibacteriales bacterium]
MFAVIGEALLDMVQPDPGGAFLAKPGGGPMNIAIGLQRLAHPTALMARLSNGPLGEIVRHHIESNELDLGTCVSTGDQTTLAFASLDEQRRASYEFYVHGTADWGWTDAELSVFPEGTRAVHTGSVAAFLAPGADALLRLWQRTRRQGQLLLSFDPNVRPALVGERDDAVARVERFVAASHVVKASDEDLGWLYPDTALPEVLRRWSTLGPELVVMTRGPAGCVATGPSRNPLESSGRVVDVVDTIGAGDAFESGLLSAIADLGRAAPGAVKDVSDGDLTSILDRAITVSAMTCQREGADPPTRVQYDEYSAVVATQ